MFFCVCLRGRSPLQKEKYEGVKSARMPYTWHDKLRRTSSWKELKVCIALFLSVCLFVGMSVGLFVPVCRFPRIFACSYVCIVLFVRLFVRMSECLFVRLSIFTLCKRFLIFRSIFEISLCFCVGLKNQFTQSYQQNQPPLYPKTDSASFLFPRAIRPSRTFVNYSFAQLRRL